MSPLLSNIVLDELDRELEKRGHRFVRYADDCVRHEARYVHGARAPTANRRAVSLSP
jgi:retron-type reverse transcriptase